ncbi:hypothetical protein Purlil1_14040 [Purpureocillium lilacinum]|uniref:LysM domain-containing protein n=1 Tax=Purpureocillium lilacinum TaxID=33203 RepID=A0ABR0BCH9_PURLI|nr:hypothetical protein Purlil1_14040 [Purpureocillium lilacinum]
MLSPVVLTLVTITAATCSTSVDLWKVQRNDTVDEAARVLGLGDYRAIQDINPGMNTAYVSPGDVYSVPYTSHLVSPGRWSTSACTRMLYLRDAASQISAASSTSVGETPVSETSSHCPGSSSLAEPSSPSADSASSTSNSPASQQSTQSLGSTVNSVSDPEPSKRSYTTTHSTISAATPTASGGKGEPPAPSSTPVTGKCHLKGSFLTVNSTQSNFAESFCKRHENVGMTQNSKILVELFDGGDNHLYFYSVDWVDGCEIEKNPTITSWGRCVEIMRANYEQCTTNGGMGGYSVFGCLKYRYMPLSAQA